LQFKALHSHIEVFGTSGFGKSRLMALIVRQFIHFGWSLFLVDPKGGDKQEVAQWVYDFAAEAGLEHLVTRIMPSYPHISDKANPIYGMTNVEIASLCSSLVVSSSGTQSSDEQFFSGQVYRTTYSILAGMSFLEKALYPDKAEINRKVVEEVQKYINFRENRAYGDKVFDDGVVQFPDAPHVANANIEDIEVSHAINSYNRTLVTFRELAFYSTFDNLVKLYGTVDNTPCPLLEDKKLENEIKSLKEVALRSLKELVTMDKAFYEKVGTSLSVLLSQLAYGPVGKVLCDIRINPLIKRARSNEGMIVIFQPAPMRFEKVSEILIKVYTKMWLSLFGTVGASGRGIRKRVAFVIDEAKPMMFPGVEEIYNKARQLGMTIMALYQSKSDIKYKLGKELADIVSDNTSTSIIMKQTSINSQLEAAAAFGTVKRAENVQMTEMDGGGRTTVVYNEVEKVSSVDIDNLEIGHGFIRHYGEQYFVKFPYQRDPFPIDVVMPKLDSEDAYEFLAQTEAILTNESKIIENANKQKELTNA
jgi:hypothetical protein